eukprot:c32264_g1_i1 orf=47-259(+)
MYQLTQTQIVIHAQIWFNVMRLWMMNGLTTVTKSLKKLSLFGYDFDTCQVKGLSNNLLLAKCLGYDCLTH